MSQQQINIKNRKASYEYHLLDTFEAGIMLLGTEIKSLREGRASLAEAYCYFNGTELFIKNMHIGEYSHGNSQNHEPLRERKLLLRKKELEKLQTNLEKGGNNTIIPLNLFINDKGLAKIRISLATGKKLYDKRDSLKQKDQKREMDRREKY